MVVDVVKSEPDSRAVASIAACDKTYLNDILDALAALWRRRLGKPPANDKGKARQVRFLQSRGFSLSAIFKLLKRPPGEVDADAR